MLAAFAFARLEFRGKNIAFVLFLSLMMIPNELVVITNFVTVTNMDMRNTFMGLILPSVTSVFYIYLLKENFAQVPSEPIVAVHDRAVSVEKREARNMQPIGGALQTLPELLLQLSKSFGLQNLNVFSPGVAEHHAREVMEGVNTTIVLDMVANVE